MVSKTNKMIKQFARVGKIFSRPLIKSKHPKLFLLADEHNLDSIIHK